MSTGNDKTITATLVRGRVYVFESTFFDRNKPTVVTAGLAQQLEQLYDEIVDSDGEVVEKPLFKVDYEATSPEDDQLLKAVPRGRNRQKVVLTTTKKRDVV